MRDNTLGSALTDPSVPRPDPYRWTAIVLAFFFVFTLPAIVAVLALVRPLPPGSQWAAAAAELGVDPYVILLGESTYRETCALCHGPTAAGVLRLGKPLRNSAFVQQHTDAQLLDVIASGRPPSEPDNTTGVLMPARGGQGLSDDELDAVVKYLRAIQDRSKPPVSVEAWVIDRTVATDGPPLLGAGGIGHDLFVASCSACHGSKAEGLDGLGKPLDKSRFIDSKTDEELVKFVKAGRPIWDDENTTGLDMPSKGGNPTLTDAQIADIVKYIRSLHK